MTRHFFPLSLMMIIAGLSACGTVKYACPAPNGVSCKSVSEVHAARMNGTALVKAAVGATTGKAPGTPATYPLAATPGDPARTEPKVLRLWIKGWQEKNGSFIDWHDQSYVYLEIDHGRWLIPTARMIQGPDPKLSEKRLKTPQREMPIQQAPKPAPTAPNLAGVR